MEDPCVADGFDENDLRILARRADALREKLRGFNGELPFERETVLKYLALLEDARSPSDARLVLDALRDIRRILRDALIAITEDEIEQDVEDIDVALAGLLGALQETLLPFADQTEESEQNGQAIAVSDKPVDIDALRQLQRELRETARTAIQTFTGNPFAMAVTAGVLASLINPWVLAGFAALYFLAKL
jgi:hypothetical protein